MDDLTSWLEDTGLLVSQVRGNEWQLQMSHQYADYTVTIINHGNWISYGADLIGDVVGDERDEFYRSVLQLNARLNGTRIALEDGRLVLVREDFFEDINQYRLYRSLNLFHQAHEYVYSIVLDEADKRNLFIPDP